MLALGLRFEGIVIDCIALSPSAAELAECIPWLEVQDSNELSPAYVRSTLEELAGRLSHAI